MVALLFSARAPSGGYGAILEVFAGDHKFSEKEHMAEWVAAGHDPRLWRHYYIVVYISDKSVDELLYLKEGHGFTVPDPAHPDFKEMRDTGEMTRLFAQVEHYIVAL